MNNEKWRPISGYEGMYEVSDKGRVKSLKREIQIIRQGHPQMIYVDEKILKPRLNGNKYHCVALSNGKGKNFSVHRLVAIAFIFKPESKEELCVNHKNGIKTDNNVDNLEWVTFKQNSQHAVDTGLRPMSDNFLKLLYERAIRTTLDLETGIYYSSIKEAAHSISIKPNVLYQRISKGKKKRFILI